MMILDGNMLKRDILKASSEVLYSPEQGVAFETKRVIEVPELFDILRNYGIDLGSWKEEHR